MPSSARVRSETALVAVMTSFTYALVMSPEQWPSEWMRGVLGVCVLRTLLDGPNYGYAITQNLTAAGLGNVKGGTLYPLLARLEESGFVEVEWRPGEGGPGRKYFSLTPQGRAHARSLAELWADFTKTTRELTDGALEKGRELR